MRRVRIYEVQADVGVYQYLLPIDYATYLRTHPIGMRFDGSEISLPDWQPPPVYSEAPKRPEADFWDFGAMANTFLVRPQAIAIPALRDLLLRCGQLLPLPYRDEEFALFNVTTVADALDDTQSVWVTGSTGRRLSLTKYAFRVAALPKAPLFKLPTQAGGSGKIWATEGIVPAEEEFKPMVQRLGLTGLIFKEVWSEDA
jgi:hypothetical protein